MRVVTDPDAAEFHRSRLFFEIYQDLPRAGPGDPESARRAVSMMTGLPKEPMVLDVGCGPGAGTLELAALTGGRIAAFDLHKPFLDRLQSEVRKSGLSGRIDVLCSDMRRTPFAAGSFDLVWSEGALCSVGFREGLAVCRGLTKSGGYLAASEAVWTAPDPPSTVRRWWESEYPAIDSISEKASDVVRAGFDLVGHFTLPASAWWDHYYAPMRDRLERLRVKWAGDAAGMELIAQHELEISIFERFGDCYGYEFFVGCAG